MNINKLKTDYTKKKEARELAIYNDYQKLLSIPGAMKEAAKQVVMKKYGIHAKSTIWAICKRIENKNSQS